MNISDHEGIRQLLNTLGMGLGAGSVISPEIDQDSGQRFGQTREVAGWPTQQPRYNTAPTQMLDVVVMKDGLPVATSMSWGVSMAAKGKKGQLITRRLPNARSDKVWSSYLWRYLIPQQRVLIPVNGFYEWRRENRKLVATYHITPVSTPAMFFAGIYRKPEARDQPCEVSLITTEANQAMSQVHDRMPVILSTQNAANAWIQENDRESLDELMLPAPNDALQFTQVGEYVNKSTNEGAECVRGIAG